jgi:hypothetical protein
MQRLNRSFRRLFAAGFLCLLCGPVLGQSATQDLEHATVLGRRDLDQMPLANFLAARRAFTDGHNLAPDASLRFVVIPRDAHLAISRVRLTIEDPAGAEGTRGLELPLAADGSFTLPDEAAFLSRDAMVRSSQPAGSLHWRPLVVTPGEPADTRRLGDLRLECQAKEAGRLNRPDLPFLARVFGGSSVSECASDDEHFFLAPAALSSVTLDDGKRQLEIAPDRVAESSSGRLIPRTYHLFEDGWRERSYSPPLGDAGWSNDALVRFHYSASALQSSQR